MAKVIDRGSAKPDDPIYTSGPVIGGVRFHNPPKDPELDLRNARATHISDLLEA
jgi:hypothetical protein